MAVKLNIVGNRQVVAPVRFAGRAVTGRPRDDVPDIDDRGFAMGTRPGGWGTTDARGAMIGITEEETVTLRVLREDIEAGAALFVTSSNTAVCEVTFPAGGGPLNRDGDVTVRGVDDVSGQAAKLEVRFGSATGPVIGEAEVHVFAPRTVPVCVHRVTVNGTAVMSGGSAIPAQTGRSNVQITRSFNVVNAIWASTGIRFRIRRRRNTTVSFTHTSGNITGSNQGCVTIDDSSTNGNWWRQHDELMGSNNVTGMVNVYFVRRIWDASSATGGSTLGLGTSRTAGANHYGVTLPDGADDNDLAHELGHVLNLDFHGGDSIGHADDVSGTSHARKNIWTLRRLMYSFNPYGPVTSEPAYFRNVGYGNHVRGALLSIKNLARDPADSELQEARSRARGPLP